MCLVMRVAACMCTLPALQAEEDRRRVLEAVRSVFEHLASGLVLLMADPVRAATLAAWLLGVAAGYFVLK
jgi:hypothetical protein